MAVLRKPVVFIPKFKCLKGYDSPLNLLTLKMKMCSELNWNSDVIAVSTGTSCKSTYSSVML